MNHERKCEIMLITMQEQEMSILLRLVDQCDLDLYCIKKAIVWKKQPGTKISVILNYPIHVLNIDHDYSRVNTKQVFLLMLSGYYKASLIEKKCNFLLKCDKK